MEFIKKEKVERLIASLILSIFIWMYVTNIQNPIETKVIQVAHIKLLNSEILDSKKLAIDNDNNLNIDVVIKGRSSEISSINESDILASIDFKKESLKEGTNNLSIDIKSLNNKIQIVKEKTSMKINVVIDKMIEKEFNITANITGNVNKNYINLEPILSKNTVIISGTKNKLNNIKYVYANVDLTDYNKTFNEKVELRPINNYGEEVNQITLKNKNVNIFIPIKYKKNVPIFVNIIKQPPKGYTLNKYNMNDNNITIIGDKNELDNISTVYTEPVDLSRRYYDFDKKVNILLPNNVMSINNLKSTYITFIIDKN